MPQEAQAMLAVAYGRLGRWRESLDHVARLGPISDETTVENLIGANFFSVASEMDARDTTAAARYAEELGLGNDLTRTFIAFGLATEGRGGEATRILDHEISDEEPRLAELDAVAGLAYLTAGLPERALARFRRFAKRGPAFAKVLIGSAAAAAGDTDQALSEVTSLRDDKTELGRLADLCAFLVDRATEGTWRDVRAAGYRAFEERRPTERYLELSWSTLSEAAHPTLELPLIGAGRATAEAASGART
jgi:hypothetical protein